MPVAAVRLDEEAVAVALCAETTCVFEEDLGLALAHFAEHNDVVGVLLCISTSFILHKESKRRELTTSYS